MAGSRRMSAARDVGANTAWVGCGPGSGRWCWGERDHRTAVYCEVPSAAMVEEPD